MTKKLVIAIGILMILLGVLEIRNNLILAAILLAAGALLLLLSLKIKNMKDDIVPNVSTSEKLRTVSFCFTADKEQCAADTSACEATIAKLAEGVFRDAPEHMLYSGMSDEEIMTKAAPGERIYELGGMEINYIDLNDEQDGSEVHVDTEEGRAGEIPHERLPEYFELRNRSKYASVKGRITGGKYKYVEDGVNSDSDMLIREGEAPLGLDVTVDFVIPEKL